ncbi:hypothetical protein TSUD_363250 [Trifolium subterraneum]|uniref:Uncharacterized protein n=1 Tax=Trifolium subterraneum TaxID=3900 RepID=A0A2Z6MKS7_TRISU|nr:hypothetical protein TSUD_363250 [Trifolium subterraneum]
MENNGKCKRKEDENGSTSITSPPSTKKDVREALDTEVKNISFVNLISESDKQSNMQSKEHNGYFDDWNPNFFKPANCDVQEGLTQRVTTLETVVPSILKSIEELKEIVKSISCTHNTPSSGVPHDNTMEDLCQKSDKDHKEAKHKESVRILFSEKGDKSPLVLTETLKGSYTVTPRKGTQTHSKLVGPTIPKSTFMEKLLMNPSFYGTDSNYGKRITEFKLVTPKGLRHQGEGS